MNVIKKIITVCCLVMTAWTAGAESWNPYVNAAITSPDPMVPAEFGGTGTLSFNVGNTGSDIMPLTASQEMTMAITLSFGVPDNVDPLAALGGSWKSMFDWTYETSNNTYRAIQNQDIPGSETNNPALGDITIDYRVTENSFYPSTVNGFNANVQPPAYTIGFNVTSDDAASSYTFVEAFDYGDAPASYGSASAEIDLSKNTSDNYINYVFLGSSVDPESTNQPSVTASGDDITGTDDEDGVSFPTLTTDSTVTIPVVVTAADSGAIGFLNAWIDWNGNGDFEDAGEMIVDNRFVAGSATINLTVTIPADAITTEPTFARFRFGSHNPGTSGLATYGEVEDYQISIQEAPAAVGDRVWDDLNGNGAQDAGEPGLTNVTVRLLDVTSNEVATVVTDVSGSYIFTNLPPATYLIEFVPPDPYVFTLRDSSLTNNLADSDADVLTGRTAPFSLSTGTNNLTVDAGLYVPAELFGYFFMDKNDDQIRNSGDTAITNAVVQLIVNGVIDDTTQTTQTDTNGWYEFTDVPAGFVTVQAVQTDATLVAVPDSTDVMRNRAISNAIDTAVIEFSVVSGYGVLAANSGEPLNFGYLDHLLSTQIDLKVYEAGNGKVMIEIYTVNENGNNDIEIYAIMDGDWVMVAMVPSEQVEGTGSHLYTVEAAGLTPGQSYMFKIVDESGHTFYTDTAIEVALMQLRALSTSLDPEYFTMKFNTEPSAEYVLKVSSSLAADAEWTTEYVQIVHPLFPNGVSSFTQRIQGAPEGTTTLRVPRNRDKAFFKIIKVE
ncbi:MAG: GEVED domain-containing protein [Kiritimatiellae bacterium]|jgi:archaellum component FlaG (FlaF/FlaG flagellin family)|nr:GEVED domain-containing protein [Kiritimatiellia bacterium]